MPTIYVFSILLLALSAILSITGAAYCSTIGVTYDSSAPDLPAPEHVVKTLRRFRVQAVHILNPTPPAIRAFSYTKLSLLLSVPNQLISSFAANRSIVSLWLQEHILPFYPRSRISAISVGTDVFSFPSSSNWDPSTTLLPAIRNVYDALQELSVKTISVSTSFTFIKIMGIKFPPSSAEFEENVFGTVIKPLLQFLQETNSSFMVNIYPYNFYKLYPEIPIGYVMFKYNPLNFHDDVVNGVRYQNLFDMMVDGVIAALAMKGHENIPVIVTGTGWPSSSASVNGTSTAEPQATDTYAEMYLAGLISHLKSGLGTPLRKEGLAGVYIYQLFDEDDASLAMDNATHPPWEHWGILYPNMTMKYKINDFSISIGADHTGGGILRLRSAVVPLVISILLLL